MVGNDTGSFSVYEDGWGCGVCVCVCCAPIISSYYARMDDEVKLGLINALTNCSSFAIVGHGRVQL